MSTKILSKSEDAVPVEAPSYLEQQIIRQIEHYFGACHLSRNKFLRAQMKLNNGWIPLKRLVKFPRLKKLSQDFNVIAGALKKSSNQLMEVNKDCTKIRRRTAAPIFPKDYYEVQKELQKRTLYVKGFKKAITLDELLEFFKDYKVENLLRRHKKPFQDSVTVTFESREEAERFLGTKEFKYNGANLIKAWTENEMLKKEQEIAKEQEESKRAAANEIIHGCLLKIENLKEDTTREQIQDVLKPYGTILCIDYSKGKPSATLRFEGGPAKSVLEKILKDGETVKIGSSKATITGIVGEEKKEYWKNIAIWWRNQQRKNSKTNYRDESSEPSQKQTKVEVFETTDKKDSTAEPPQKKMKVEVS